MYIFLASEIMFFGSLFATYFYLASSHTHWPPGGFTPVEPIPVPAVNTVVLLSSGVTMHISHLAIQAGNRRRFISWLVVTIVLGTGFEIGQVYEFLRAEVFRTFTANEFATAFFTMTGFHGLHVLGGLIFLVIVLARALGGQFSADPACFRSFLNNNHSSCLGNGVPDSFPVERSQTSHVDYFGADPCLGQTVSRCH